MKKNEANRVRRIFSKVARAGSGWWWSAGQRWCRVEANASFLDDTIAKIVIRAER